MQDKDRNFQNILVIDFGQLGDVVLSLPAMRAIRQKFSDASISVLTGMAGGEVVTLSGLADDVIRVDRVELRDGPKLRSIGKILRFVGEIRRRRFDLVIDLHSLSETNLLGFLSKARHRVFANRENRSLDWLSNFTPRPPREDKSKTLADRYLDVLTPFGITNADRNFRFQTSAAEAEFVDQRFFTGRSERKIGLFPGAGHPSRCWSLEHFVALAGMLEKDGSTPVIFLGPEEAAKKEQMTALFSGRSVIIDGLSIAQFIAAASRLDAFVTNDTGPMHLAACAGTGILLLPDKWPPFTYLPLTENLELIDGKTIKEITVDDAYDALNRLISKIYDGRK